MKLYEVVKSIENIAKSQPAVHTVFEGSVYQLNELKDIKYGAVVISQTQHIQQGDFIRYGFNIFYCDRLTETGDNKLNVQSTALDCLDNIIKAMKSNDFDFDSVVYHTFTERFESECAGAYAEITFEAPMGNICEEVY